MRDCCDCARASLPATRNPGLTRPPLTAPRGVTSCLPLLRLWGPGAETRGPVPLQTITPPQAPPPEPCSHICSGPQGCWTRPGLADPPACPPPVLPNPDGHSLSSVELQHDNEAERHRAPGTTQPWQWQEGSSWEPESDTQESRWCPGGRWAGLEVPTSALSTQARDWRGAEVTAQTAAHSSCREGSCQGRQRPTQPARDQAPQPSSPRPGEGKKLGSSVAAVRVHRGLAASLFFF